MRQFRLTTVSVALGESAPEEKSVEDRFKVISGYLEEAAGINSDFVCLPEYFAYHGWMNEYFKVKEKLGEGPVSSFCAEWAKKGNMNVICTLPTDIDGKMHNLAVLFDRTGKLAAQYSKTHLAGGNENEGKDTEWGDALDVFDVEGVKVGFQICYDLNFPEAMRVLALKGAELVFWPTMWSGPTEHFCECIMRARAMENLLTLVGAAYVNYPPGDPPGHWAPQRKLSPTMIIDWGGFILASAGSVPGIASAVVDFDRVAFSQMDREKNRGDHRRPDLYGPLVAK